MTPSEDPRFVVCVERGEYLASLEPWRIYRVVSDPEAETLGLLRVVDDSGEDYLYPARSFHPIELPPLLRQLFASASMGRRR